VEFFGPTRVMFGTDTPFDTKGGAHFIPATISDIEDAVPDNNLQSEAFQGTACRVLGIQP
jgi:hypothetical protein